MLTPIKILAAKLQIPHCHKTIPRGRFDHLAADIPAARLTTISGGGGYGKTTLAAQIAAAMHSRVVWYRIDRSDEDYVCFLFYLIYGIRRHFPKFGNETLARIIEAENTHRERRVIFTLFQSETEKHIQKPLILFLDDYHTVEQIPEIREFLESFLENAPDFVNLVIIGRSEPHLSISRLRTKHLVIDIGEKDLEFTADETEQLYLSLLNRRLEKEQLYILHAYTGGWIAGLILYFHVLKHHNAVAPPKLPVQIDRTPKVFLKYLQENIYEPLPPETKTFLKYTSVLAALEVDVCNRLLNCQDAGRTLQHLENCHLFTSSTDEEGRIFQYHQLFHSFLLSMLVNEHGPAFKSKLHAKAADIYEEKGEVEESLSHRIQGRQFEKVFRILNQFGERIGFSGRPRLIRSFIEQLPEPVKRQEPLVRYTEALLLMNAGLIKEAEAIYKEILGKATAEQDIRYAGACRVCLGRIYFYSGDLNEAEHMLEDAIKHDKLEAQQLWSALMLLIYTTAFKGDVLVSDNYCRMAEELLAQIHDPWGNDIYRARFLMAKGFRLKHSGDYEEALGVLEQALKIATHKKYHRIQAMCHQQALWYLYALGRFEEGIHRAGKALDIIDRMGFDYLFLKAWVYIDMAFNHAGLNQMERAVVLAKEAMKHFREMNYAVGQTCYHWFRCMASMKLGNMRDAEHHALSGFVVAQKHYSGQYDHELKLQKVAILIGNGDFKNAHQLLHSVHADINQSKWHVARGRYLESWLAMAQGNRKEAAARLAETLWLCEENGYDFNVLAIPFQCVPTLRELFQNGLHRDYIECILEKAGIDHGDVISKQDSNYMPKPVFSISAPNLKIHLLGKFMVSVGDRDITHQAWNGRKEQLLFKYLAYTRGTGFSKKEILMELLWPEEDPLITVKRFHVILAYLKKALEPEKQRGAPSAYIVKAGDAYMLETGKEGFIDTERFSQEFDLAKKAASPNDKLRHLLQCEALYIGDLLHEDAYAQWCVEPRERFKQNYLHVLREVISIHQAERDMGACISYTNRYLATDKYAEDIYRMQMRYYSKMGNVSMVKKTYDACYDAIEKELDCHLADETKRLLAQLMG